MNENTTKFVLKVFILLFLLFSLVFLIYKNSSLGKHFFFQEGLETILETDMIPTKNNAFCENHRGSSNTLDDDCRKLTQRNCNATSCCVFTSENKCVAGGQGGPTFNSDAKGKTKNLDYYYYQNKCYGPNCGNL